MKTSISATRGKYQRPDLRRRTVGAWLVPLSFFLIEGFAFLFLNSWQQVDLPRLLGLNANGEGQSMLWPLAFGLVWAALLTGLVRLLPGRAGKWAYCALYYLFLVYAIAQTGIYQMFGQMYWTTDFRYASEGADYLDVLLSYPAGWWLSLLAMLALGVVTAWHFPRPWKKKGGYVLSALLVLAAGAAAWNMPQLVFLNDGNIRYAGSDYGRAESAQAAYENMFSAHRLYGICGVFQTAVKDVYANYIFPITPSYVKEMEAGQAQVDAYFGQMPEGKANEMTGLLEGKNVILVLMESMDDWMLGEHTPTLNRLMSQGIRFDNFYTPGYGGIRTFNTEFCINTGSYLSTNGKYAFDYVTNCYDQSLANRLTQAGYSALTFHYNEPEFYSRGVFSPAMGYEKYVCYQDYASKDSKVAKEQLYDDCFLFDSPELSQLFFREGKTLNFLITRSAHLSYKYNEVLSYWGLKKYPQYRGLTGNEETDCAYLKAKLVDDLFARLMEELEKRDLLENTVIIGVTDHYTYGYKNEKALLELSGVDSKLLLEKTPCFIWSQDLTPQTVEKVVQTADLLPTMLNLLGIQSPYRYLGRDAFDPDYPGYALFADGSWISGEVAYDASSRQTLALSPEQGIAQPSQLEQMRQINSAFVAANNMILKTDYYQSQQEKLEEMS